MLFLNDDRDGLSLMSIGRLFNNLAEEELKVLFQYIVLVLGGSSRMSV